MRRIIALLRSCIATPTLLCLETIANYKGGDSITVLLTELRMKYYVSVSTRIDPLKIHLRKFYHFLPYT